MKNLVSVAIFALFATGLFAEDDERTMAISVSPIAPVFGGLSAMYQLKMTDFLALTVPANFYYSYLKSNVVKSISESKSGKGQFEQTKSPYDMSLGLGARFLLKNRGLSDTFYIEPRVSLGYEQFGVKVMDTKFETEAMKITPLLKFGWDWYWESGFYMSMGAGVGFNYYFNNKTTIPAKYKDQFVVSWFFPPQEGTLKTDWEAEFKLGYAW